MPTNPLYSTNNSPNNQTQPTKAVNNQGVHVKRSHNTFDMSYFNYKTQRFGQLEPFFVMEGVPGDRLPFSSSHNVRSLPFATPFLTSLKLNKDYFMIPNQAIQPRSWEYIFKNPSQGEDVSERVHNNYDLFGGDGYRSDEVDLLKSLITCIVETSSDQGSHFLWSLLNAELFFSSGSLLYNLGFKLNPIFLFENGTTGSFDYFFDSVLRNSMISIKVTVDGNVKHFTTDESANPQYVDIVNTSSILDLLRFFGSSAEVTEFYSPDATNYTIVSWSNLPTINSRSSIINMDRLCAYQLACWQYYVNPQVDFIYNAQLYRDNFLNTLLNLDPEFEASFFSVNGVKVLYDSFSLYYYSKLNHYVCSSVVSGDYYLSDKWYDVFALLFGYNSQLKFGDYFTDSRTRPLAVGDSSISVQTDNTVSVIDVSEKIVFQRFRNAVVKLGNNFDDYLRGIYGTSPSPDYHFPKYIVHQEFEIKGTETANTTSDGQGDLVTNLITGDDTFVFEVDVDMPCIIMGISYFSLPMVYSQTKERHFLHRDRFDMFNPMLQYIGDQPIYLCEKSDAVDPNTDISGYLSRYNEYKQRYSQASGGFIEKLPAWSFVIDDLFNSYRDLSLTNVQSPVAIRLFPYQFNRFFKAMSGLSLSSSFHFIVVYNNKCVCNRAMEVNPNIL